jgi:hypothetical protein
MNHKDDRPPARDTYCKCPLKHENTTELRIFHQNIIGLRNKIDELSSFLHPHWTHVVCLTDHDLNPLEVENINIVHYEKGALYCRKNFRMGGVVIFIHNSISFSCMNMDKLCAE